MSAPQAEAGLSTKVSELLHLCAGLGMAPPEFSYVSKQQVRSQP